MFTGQTSYDNSIYKLKHPYNIEIFVLLLFDKDHNHNRNLTCNFSSIKYLIKMVSTLAKDYFCIVHM